LSGAETFGSARPARANIEPIDYAMQERDEKAALAVGRLTAIQHQ
jgi:hypothetical protein